MYRSRLPFLACLAALTPLTGCTTEGNRADDSGVSTATDESTVTTTAPSIGQPSSQSSESTHAGVSPGGSSQGSGTTTDDTGTLSEGGSSAGTGVEPNTNTPNTSTAPNHTENSTTSDDTSLVDTTTTGDTTSAPQPVACDGATTLRQAGDCTERLVGVALAASYLGESGYAAAAREHSYVTAENEMKWGNLEPSRSSYNWGPADQIVNFALNNDMQVKGHALIWHRQLPQWVTNLSNAADVRSAMITHIQTVMDHFRGKVTAWDVINEAFEDDTDASLRDSVFSRHLGSAFIDEAFQAARDADPSVKLYYNDYDTENLSAKSNAVYEMVRSMVERGVPIDGVGLQMHLRVADTEPSLAELEQNMQRIADLGLEVLISEMDVRLCNGETEEQQVARFHDVVALCIAQPKCPAITFWGITDRYSWLTAAGNPGCPDGENPHGLLWNDNYMKKPAYDGVMQALTGQ